MLRPQGGVEWGKNFREQWENQWPCQTNLKGPYWVLDVFIATRSHSKQFLILSSMRHMTSLLLMSACPHLSLICSHQLIGRVSRECQMLSGPQPEDLSAHAELCCAGGELHQATRLLKEVWGMLGGFREEVHVLLCSVKSLSCELIENFSLWGLFAGFSLQT